MAAVDRTATILGSMLIGIAAFLIVADRISSRSGNRRNVPVEQLAEDLKQAWAEHHIR